MDKTVVIFRFLVLKGILILCNNLYSQELYTKKLHWFHYDFSCKVSFNKSEKALEWSKYQIPFVLNEKENEKKWRMEWDESELSMIITHSKLIKIKNQNFYLIIGEGCSGIPCQNIYLFRKIKQSWCLIANSQARLREQIEIVSKKNKIIFKVNSVQIGEWSSLDSPIENGHPVDKEFLNGE